MKTISNISLLENSLGETQFQVGNVPKSRAADKQVGLGAIAFRSSKQIVNGSDKNDPTEIAKSITKETAARNKELLNALETADATDFSGGPDSDAGSSAPVGSVMSDLVSRNALIDVLQGVLTRHDPKKHSQTICDIYRDMYYHDPTCGSAIELLATIPFSDFSLTGVKDEKMARVFLDSIESMNCELLLPNISVDYNCIGGVVLSTRWDERDKAYRGVVPHRMDYCTFSQVPVFGVDPIISVSLPAYLMEAIQREEVRKRYQDFIPLDLLKDRTSDKKGSRTGGGIELTPEDTIFIPRRAFLKDFSGVSLLRRALPAWLYEKALIRGTLDQVYKRQRAIGHVTVEHTEEWVPSPEEMQVIASMFLNADIDPLGSVLVTRSGVNYNEVRRGDDFWRWDQNYDVIEKIKLRALGVSEAFVSADVTYNQMEQALSVFMESVKDYRARITRELFYEKTFLRISMAHGYTKKKAGNVLTTEMASMFGNSGIYYDDNQQLTVNIGSDTPVSIPSGFMNREIAANIFGANASDYITPTVIWRKRLMPEADEAYMQILSLAEEKGVPVTLRHWIAGAGMHVDSLMQGLDEDLRLREKVYEYQQDLAELKKEFKIGGEEAPAGGEGGGEAEAQEELEFARYLANRAVNPTGSMPRKSILSRGNPDAPQAEIANLDHAGRRRFMSRKGRAIRLEKYNKIIAEASVELARRENHEIKLQEDVLKEQATRKIYT